MERASRRKYHYIYKTTCTITNRFYIGMHSTDNLEDGYIGSGKRLWYSINKHGKDNHVCEILEFLPDRKALKAKEKQIVNVELINEELCMNLQLGGGGGFINEEHASNFHKAGGRKVYQILNKRHVDKLKNDSVYKKSYSKKLKEVNSGCKNPFFNKKHSEEAKRKIGESNSIKQKGSNNSQYGKCWITNEYESMKINKGDMIPSGWRLGRKM